MAETLYREFKIESGNLKAITNALRTFWSNAIVPWTVKGKRILMIITSEDQKRNTQQNARLWGYVYKQIAEQAWVNGQQYPADVWHEALARQFWVCEDITLPDGEIVSRRKSTTEMSVGEFAKYMTEVEAHAASELGVMFSA